MLIINFRIFNKTPPDENLYNLNHVSYHKIKLDEENFGALINSKVECFLHMIDTKQNNEDILIGRAELEINKIILAKDFFFTANIDLNSNLDLNANKNQKKNQPKSKVVR